MIGRLLYCCIDVATTAGGDHRALPDEVGGAPGGAHVFLPARCARLRQGVGAAAQAPPGRQQHVVLRRGLRD